MARHTLLIPGGLACALLAACVRLPEPTSAPRPPTSISASVARTWDAVIDQLGQQAIPLRSMEKASGFIATHAAFEASFDAAVKRRAEARP